MNKLLNILAVLLTLIPIAAWGTNFIEEEEFVENSIIEDKILAKQIFEKMDVDGKGELSLPRYLKIWGNWARED